MKRWAAGISIGVAGYCAVCGLWGGFARAALDGFALPVMAALHRLTAPLPFPAAEALALGLGIMIVLGLLTALVGRLLRGNWAALLRWLRGVGWTALLLVGALALLWAPARGLPREAVPGPNDRQLAWLCGELIDQLNASELRFPGAAEALRLAPGVAGPPSRAVKAVRHPRWMAAAHICGLFVPLTGEALVDATAPAPLVPFTAVHELMHLAGIADEGAANIAAWQRCLEAGGPFSDSARLWALRYALGQLRRRDEASWRRVCANMNPLLRRVYSTSGGEAAPTAPPTLGDYAALVGYLAGRP